MKKLFYFIVIFMSMNSCKTGKIEIVTPPKSNSTTNTNVSTGEIQFQPEFIDIINSSLNSRLEAIDVAKIIVTIEDDKGNIVKNKVSINLINFNGSYTSQPLVLKDGFYSLKEFLVADALNNVQYATPVTGSTLASLVSTPLPMTFTITKQKPSSIIPQVISTLTKKPGSFGYLTFNFNIIETLDFYLAVFAFNPTKSNFELVVSEVTLNNGTTDVFKGTVPANVQVISIKDEKSGNYNLEVSKPDFKTYNGTYTYSDLQTGFDNPINIILESSSTSICAVGLVKCSNLCVNVLTDIKNCGSCGVICEYQNAISGCNNGECFISSCATGFVDCNGVKFDGCEVNLNNPGSCGSCGAICEYQNAISGCNNGECFISSCATGFADCNGSKFDGCEVNLNDPSNCGSCSNVCPTGTCANQTCQTSK